jgi:speckle-type POZ protein
VAADRYAIERLKLICQSILCNNLDVQNVATTLALADQHHCDKLKHACVEFMCCSNNVQDVVATQGYMDLAKTSPSVLADAMARMSKISKKVMTRALQAQDGSSI